MKKEIEAFVCDLCDKAFLNRDSLFKCIVCGKEICNGVNCSYNISVDVHHNIPNGIPFLHTKIEYRICKKCLSFNKPIPRELNELLQPKNAGKLYRLGDEYEPKWVFITER